MILDDILSSQRSYSIKSGLGFHEIVNGKYSSQTEARNSNTKSKMLNKEIRGQPNQQPRKESFQTKSFTPNYGSVNRFFLLMNNVECFICHFLDMLQLDAEAEWLKLITVTQKSHQLLGTLRDIVFLAICLVTKQLTIIEGI